MRTLPCMESRLVLVTLFAAAVLAPACSSSSKKSTCSGAVRCDCYPNHTCDEGLVCLSNMCVAQPGGTGGVTTLPPAGTGGAISDPGLDAGGVVSGAGGATVIPGAGGALAGTGGAVVIPGFGGATVIPGLGGSIGPSAGGTVVIPKGTGGAIAVGTGGAIAVGTGGAVVSTGGVVSKGGATGTSVSEGGIDGGVVASPYITAKDGWATDPAHQVQGPVYTYTDDGGSDIYPACKATAGVTTTCFAGTGTTTQFCASGTVAQALTASGENCELTSDYCDWSTYWGTALAINLNQSADATEGAAWNGSAYSGVSFDIAISARASNLRLYVNLVDGTQYCYTLSSSKTYTLAWSQFRRDCHTTGGAALSGTALAQIKSLAWQSGTDASYAHPYDFCVDRVKIN